MSTNNLKGYLMFWQRALFAACGVLVLVSWGGGIIAPKEFGQFIFLIPVVGVVVAITTFVTLVTPLPILWGALKGRGLRVVLIMECVSLVVSILVGLLAKNRLDILVGDLIGLTVYTYLFTTPVWCFLRAFEPAEAFRSKTTPC